MSERERAVVGRSNFEQLVNLMVVLHGSESDFADCLVAVAEALGWDSSEAGDILEAEAAAAAVIDGASWATLRAVSVDVFMELRGGAPVYPRASWDRRSAGERIDDALFVDGSCRLCVHHPEVPRGEHRNIAAVVASGRRTWDQVDEALTGETRHLRPTTRPC